MSELDLYR